MIPRVRPTYGWAELAAALRPHPATTVQAFERELAAYFGVREAITFPYGRSAIYAALRALGREGGEVVQPAYNCVVVAHATMVAGYRPLFVDAQAESPNQDEAQMVERVTSRTAAVIPTSIFGFPFDAAALCRAIRRRNPDALILMDCCQAFDARWQGERLTAHGDAALLAFGIGKPMTTLYGGALLTDQPALAERVRRYRDAHYRRRGGGASWRRRFYLLASWLALSGPLVRLTDWLEHADTPLRRYLLTLRAREAIRLPADNQTLMLPLEAAIGRAQLRRAPALLHRRREIAAEYARQLGNLPGLHLLPWPDGSTFAIYAARLPSPAARAALLTELRRHGVQGDTVLSYVVP
ncbi:MAG: DegT/DnrJ/EryC1/StrS aminotransferase family protein, partial [Caldilineae bacterium]